MFYWAEGFKDWNLMFSNFSNLVLRAVCDKGFEKICQEELLKNVAAWFYGLRSFEQPKLEGRQIPSRTKREGRGNCEVFKIFDNIGQSFRLIWRHVCRVEALCYLKCDQ